MPRVYDSTDVDVAPPTVLSQPLPPWTPPWPQLADRTFTGRLQIVVANDGSVESAAILQPSFSAYDERLLNAARQWRYGPAMKRDRPVSYRRVIEYVLTGADQRSTQR